MILTFKSRPIQRVSRYKRRICDNQLGKGEVPNVSEGKVGSPSRVVRTVRAVSFHLFVGKFMKTHLCLGAHLAIMPITISGAYLARATQQRSHLLSSTETFWGCVVTNSHYQIIFRNSKCSRSTSFSAS